MEMQRQALVAKLERVDVGALAALAHHLPTLDGTTGSSRTSTAAYAQPTPSEGVPPLSSSSSSSALARENARLRKENERLATGARGGARGGGPVATGGMGMLELVFQGLALGVPKDQLETALTAGATDGGAAAREALLKLVGSNVKRKTAQPEQPSVTANPHVPLEGGHEAQPTRKSATATAHLRHGDALLGDSNPADSMAMVGAPTGSRGLLCSESPHISQEDSCGPEVSKACKRLMSRVRMPSLDDGTVYAEQWEEKWDNFEETRDPDGELLLKIMVEAVQDSGKDSWIDPDFPPDNSSLFKDHLTADQMAALADGQQTFRKDQDPFLAGVKGIQWKRAAEMLNPDEPVVVWSQDIHSDDIQQGRLGNCYYLAALASCAVGERDVLLRDLIVEEGLPVGVFGVKFFIHGRWVTVPVDDYFPCVPWGDQWKPIFSTPSTGEQQVSGEKEIWPMIFEKAWAKLHGSYEATAGGLTCDALNYLSGGIVRNFPAHESNEEEWQRLLSLQEEHNKHDISHDKEHNPFLSCAVKSAVSSEECKLGGLINGHAYSILCIVETVDGHRLLNLRNPWGSFEWKGDFSDESPLWTDELKQEVGADDAEGDDGSFWMCWRDFCKYFDEIGVCDPMYVPKTLLEEGEVFPDKCHTHIKTVGSEWKPGVNAGGRPYNPSFYVKADADKIMLQMFQSDHRGSHDPIPWTDMYLYLIDDESDEKPKRVLHLQRRQQYTELEVEPGKAYRLMATAWGPGVADRFWISAAAKGLELYCLESPTPDEAAARQMVAQAGPACGPEALCVMCGQGPIRGSYFELEEGQCHSECHEGYAMERKKCTAPECAHCQERILDDTWSVFTEENGKTNVHKDCVQGYQESKAPKCAHCAAPLLGGYCVLNDQNLHQECVDPYRESIAPKCPQCNGPVTGSYYPYGPDETASGNDEKVHVDCSDAYDAAVRAAKG